jgi:parvulin-like peptidyl-prolyl isomerase
MTLSNGARFLPPFRILAALALAALAAGLSTGCGNDSNVLARVGDETITTADFIEVARGNEARYPGPPDSARALLLDDMVKRALLLNEARRQHVLPDSLLQPSLQAAEEQLLMSSLVEQIAPRQIDVSDAEVAEFYRWRSTQAHALVVYTLERPLVDAAKVDLERGVPFDAVADHYNLAGMLPRGGDLGFQVPGALVNPLDDQLRTAPIGQVVGPLAAPGGGWFLVKIIERTPHPQEPLAQEAPVLRETILQRKQRSVTTRAYDALRDQYHVAIEPRAGEILFRRYSRRPDGPAAAAFADPPPPTPAEAAQPLAHHDDLHGHATAYTLGDAVADLHDARRERPNFSMVPAIHQWVLTQVLRRVALLEARRRGIDRDPDVVRHVRQRADNSLLEAIYSVAIAQRAKPTPEDVQELYLQRADMFIRLDRAKVLVADVTDSAAAFQLVDHAGHAPTLREAAAMLAPGIVVTERDVRYPTKEEPWSMLSATLMAMSPHEVRGPFAQGTHWTVIQLVSKDQGRQAFENLEPPIRQALENAAADRVRERLLTELTESLRRSVRPEIHRERLTRIPWPVAPAAAPTPTAG